MTLLVIIPLLGYTLLWKRISHSSSSSAAMHTSSAMLLSLYLGAIADRLQLIAFLLLVCGSIAAIYESVNLIRNKAPLPVPLFILLFLCSLFALLHYDANFHAFDEFSHWGVFLKEMIAKDALWDNDSNAMVLRYPPGTSLWQYFFLRFTGFTEGGAYLAQFCLLMLPLLVLWQSVRYRQLFWLISIFVLIAIAVSSFGHGFASLYVDHVLGAWFGGTIFSFIRDLEHHAPRQLLTYALPVTTLVLLKDAGLFFAAAAICIIALLLFWRIAFRVPEKSWKDASLKSGTLALVSFTCAVLVSTSWAANRDAAEIPGSNYSTGGIVSGITNNESHFDQIGQAELANRFLQVVLHQQLSKDKSFEPFGEFTYEIMPLFADKFRVTTASLIVLFLLWQIVVQYGVTDKDDRWRWGLSAFGFTLTLLAYIGVLFLSYKFAFGERGMALPSYIRYTHTAILPMFLFSFLPLLPGFSQRADQSFKLPGNQEVSRPAIMFTVALLTFTALESPYFPPLYQSHEAPGMRQQLRPFIEKVRDNVDDGARVWVYLPLQDAKELRRRVFLYDMTPTRADVVTDADFLQRNSGGIGSVIEKWDYLWFPVQNPESDEILKFLFGDDLKDRLFRVQRDSEKVEIIALDGIFD